MDESMISSLFLFSSLCPAAGADVGAGQRGDGAEAEPGPGAPRQRAAAGGCDDFHLLIHLCGTVEIIILV